MADDQDKPDKPEVPKSEAQQEKGTQDTPLTSDEFKDALSRLGERAKVASMRPLQVMTTSYLKQILGVFDSFLASIEEGPDKKVKK